MTAKQARKAWIQLGIDLRREQYTPLDSVNNPSIKMLDAYKQALKEAIEKAKEENIGGGDFDYGLDDGFKKCLELIETVTPKES